MGRGDLFRPVIAAICAEMQHAGLLNDAVLVADGDTILHHEPYGPENVERGSRSLSVRSIVAFVTKARTAPDALQMVE